MLANSSQLVLRNINDLTGSVLIVEPVADQLGTHLRAQAPQLNLSCYTTDAAVANHWHPTGIACHFTLAPAFSTTFDTVVIFYPKSKEQLAFTLSQLQNILQANPQVFVVGDNKGGIKSLASHAQKLGLQANKLDNAKHCLWYSLHGDFSHLSKVEATSFTLQYQGKQLTIKSLPGVFNHGKLDTGTALLLDHLPAVSGGKVLDFACGCGVIGAVFKLHQPAIELFCSDISMLATEATKLTLAANNLSGTVLTTDGLPDQPKQFDHIISNPPFHTGIKTNYDIVEQFISQSAVRLSSKGSLTLVANTHLAYLELLQSAFKQVKVLAKANGFVVYQAIKA